MDALPRIFMKVENASFHLTHPFTFYGNRQLSLAFVEVDDEIHVRVLYRSNSQFTWRMCDATNGGHIGKGFHEFDKQGLTIDHRSDRCIREEDGRYYSREYASFVPSQPMLFSHVNKWLPTARGSRVADPAAVELPPREQLPNLQKPVVSFAFTSPAYADENDRDGELVGRVFQSFDENVRYLFFEDSNGRVSLSGVESLLPTINAMGLRSRYLETRGMDAPLIEYFLQIPEEFGGSKEGGYRSNWNYVRELPIIKFYYVEQDRTVPPAILASSSE